MNQEERILLVSIMEAAKLLLAGCVEVQRAHLHPNRR
jgi:hypothetical protein